MSICRRTTIVSILCVILYAGHSSTVQAEGSLLQAGGKRLVSKMFTFSGLVLFSYANHCTLEVRSGDKIVWSGILNNGNYSDLGQTIVPEGSYTITGTEPYAVISGEPSTRTVGYFALDGSSKPLSKTIHTFMCRGVLSHTNRFYVWSYEDNTSVTVKDIQSGSVLWTGKLDRGKHRLFNNIDDKYLTVTASQPVSAQSYDDCGFYYPSVNNSFYGTEFYGYSNNTNPFARVCVVGHSDGTWVRIEETDGTLIRQSYVDAGEVLAERIEGKTIHVTSSLPVTVCSAPYVNQPDPYYHLMEVKGPNGTGIDNRFYAPCIHGHLDFLAFEDDTRITVTRVGEFNPVYTGMLQADEHFRLETLFGVYRIEATKRISVIESSGAVRCGADFMTLNFNVEPDFQISLQPDTLFVFPGTAAACSVSYMPVFGFDGTVSIELIPENEEMEWSADPQQIGPDGVSVLSIRPSVFMEPDTLDFQVQGRWGGRVRTAPLTVVILEPPLIPIFVEGSITAGELFWAEVNVGDESVPLDRLTGVSFDLPVPDWLKAATGAAAGEWLASGGPVQLSVQILGDTIHVQASLQEPFTPVSGSGCVVRLEFLTSRAAPEGSYACFFPKNAFATDPAGNSMLLTGRQNCIGISMPWGVRPNPFTPNGDGYNDFTVFRIEALEDGGTVWITDIWGRVVRKLEGSFQWDGRDEEGRLVAPGSYLYVARLKNRVAARGVVGVIR